MRKQVERERNRIQWKPKDRRVLQIETLYGSLTVPDWPDDLIVRSLRQLGEWGAVEVATLAPLIEPDDVVWDAGAFLGTFALGLLRYTSLAGILAIEANPELCVPLSDNIERLTRHVPSRVLNVGVGRRNGQIRLRNASQDSSNYGASSYEYAETASPETRPVWSLPSLRRQVGDYTVIKLDLEGMEAETLKADRKFICQTEPVIWAECNEDVRSFELYETLVSLGYTPLYVAFPAFRRNNFNGSDDLIYPMAYEAGLLAAPPARAARLASGPVADISGEEVIIRPLKTARDLNRALFDTPRWCQNDWLVLSRPELLARLGRSAKRQKLRSFLDRDDLRFAEP